jgi:hypothetical protein
MKISETVDYPAAPEAVFAMLTDEQFQARKCVAATAIEPVGEGVRIVTKRDLPTEGLPDFAKSLIGAKLVITETYDWGPAGADGSRFGELDVEVAGAPVSLTARVGLVPNGAGSQMRIDGDLKASIPLLGGKVEKSAAPAVIDGIHQEGRTGRAWLAEHP